MFGLICLVQNKMYYFCLGKRRKEGFAFCRDAFLKLPSLPLASSLKLLIKLPVKFIALF